MLDNSGSMTYKFYYHTFQSLLKTGCLSVYVQSVGCQGSGNGNVYPWILTRKVSLLKEIEDKHRRDLGQIDGPQIQRWVERTNTEEMVGTRVRRTVKEET